MAWGLIKGICLSVILIALVMGVFFRSWKMVLISVMVNAIPLLALAWAMYGLGIGLKLSTAIIFTITYGIAVDDSLHFLTRFKRAKNQGLFVVEAVREAFFSSFRPIFLTSAILCAGFLSLAFSSVQGTYHLGILTALSLLTALLSDLFLLPLLLIYLKPQNKSQ